MKENNIHGSCESSLKVMVPIEDADMIRKVRRILKTGKNVEIRQDTNGKAKVFKVSREIIA
jgi:hypothetical protein